MTSIHETGLYSILNHTLQLALCTNNLQQAPPIAQDSLASLVLGDKADLLEAIRLRITHAPDLGCKFVTRSHRGCKTRLELSQVGRIAATQLA